MKTERGEIRIFPTKAIDARIAASGVFESRIEDHPVQEGDRIVGQIIQTLVGLDPDEAIDAFHHATSNIV